MPSSTLPSFAQVDAIPSRHDLTVGADRIDVNGHMNIQHYFLLGATAVGRWYEELGLGDDYRRIRRLSLFTAEQHLTYHAEVAAGSRISVHPRLLARSRHALHARSFIVDRTEARLACTMEIVLVHVSLDSRGATPYPDDAASWLDTAIRDQPALGWDPGDGTILWRARPPGSGEQAPAEPVVGVLDAGEGEEVVAAVR